MALLKTVGLTSLKKINLTLPATSCVFTRSYFARIAGSSSSTLNQNSSVSHRVPVSWGVSTLHTTTPILITNKINFVYNNNSNLLKTTNSLAKMESSEPSCFKRTMSATSQPGNIPPPSTNESAPGSPNNPNTDGLSRRQKLQKAVKDYGATVIVFHVALSLTSLGFFYALVSSGLDPVSWLKSLGVGESILENKITQGASTFVVAYAVHKVFAPVRITITLTATPFIVRYLRSVGVLKRPVS